MILKIAAGAAVVEEGCGLVRLLGLVLLGIGLVVLGNERHFGSFVSLWRQSSLVWSVTLVLSLVLLMYQNTTNQH